MLESVFLINHCRSEQSIIQSNRFYYIFALFGTLFFCRFDSYTPNFSLGDSLKCTTMVISAASPLRLVIPLISFGKVSLIA